MMWKICRLVVVLGFVLAAARTGAAQESVNQASVAGRVLDANGGAVPGVGVTVRHTDTNITAQATTDPGGRFRFTYLRIGTYELRTSIAGFTDHARTLVLNPGAALDSVDWHRRGRPDDRDHRGGRGRRRSKTARSQIAGTVPQAEVQNLPMNGRNFLDLALLVPGVSPTNTNSTQLFAETSAVPGQGLSIASQRNLSNSFIVDGVSANDDAAGLSGIAVRRRRHRAVPGRDGRRPGGTRPRTRRLCQRRHAERHQRTARAALQLPSRRCLQRQERADRDEAADGPAAVRRQSGWTGGAEPHVLLHQRRAEGARPDWRRQRSPTQQCRQPSTRGSPSRLSRGSRVSTGIYPNPVHSTNVLGKIDHQFSGPDSAERALCLLQRRLGQRARRRQPERAVGIDRARQHATTRSRSATCWTLVAQHGLETRAADRAWRPPGVLDRPRRAAGHDLRRRDVRHVLEQPDAAREHAVPGRQQPVAPRRRSCAAGGRRLPLQRRHHHVPARVPWQLHVLVAGQLSHGQLQRLRADVRQPRRQPEEPERRRSTRRTSGVRRRG